MARKLSDAEFTERTRAANRRRTERYQQRLAAAGKSALTVWIDAGLKAALTTTAAERGTTIADTAEALLSAALTPTIPDPEPTTTPTTTPTPTLNQAERNQTILDLHRQGVAGREIARRLGIGKTTVGDVLKRLEAAT